MKKLLLTLTLLTTVAAQATEEANEQLFAALKCGSLADAQAALNAGADINARNGWDSPLSRAIRQNDVELAEFLIEHGAEYADSDTYPDNAVPFVRAVFEEDPTIVTLMFEDSKPIGQYTLDAALQLGLEIVINDIIKNPDFIEERVALLLAHGASPFTHFSNFWFRNNSSVEGTVYDLSKQYGLTNLVLLFDTYTNAYDPDTQLFAAVERGSIADTKAALNAGADINSVRDDKTPLYLAAFNGNNELVQLLLEHGADCAMPYGDWCTLISVVRWDNHEILKLLLEKSSYIDFERLDRALYTAIEETSNFKKCDLCLEKTVTLLLEHGACPFVEFEYYNMDNHEYTQKSAYDLAKQLGLTNIVQLFTRCSNHGGVTGPACTECDCDDHCEG